MSKLFMQNIYIRKVIALIIVFLPTYIYINSCSEQSVKIHDVFMAEKMYSFARSLHRNILINPDIAGPEEYENAESSYRKVINTFVAKCDDSKELKGIVQRSWLAISDLLHLQKKI